MPLSEKDILQTLMTWRHRVSAELKKQEDPRVLGKGDVFDQYLSPRTKTVKQPMKNQ